MKLTTNESIGSNIGLDTQGGPLFNSPIDLIGRLIKRGEVLTVISQADNLRRTVGVALVVGTVLFVINQLDSVVTGRATAATWTRVVLTYLVPFCVANYGLLVGQRRDWSS